MNDILGNPSGNRRETPLGLSQGLPFGYPPHAFSGPASDASSSRPSHAAGCNADRLLSFMKPDAALPRSIATTQKEP